MAFNYPQHYDKPNIKINRKVNTVGKRDRARSLYSIRASIMRGCMLAKILRGEKRGGEREESRHLAYRRLNNPCSCVCMVRAAGLQPAAGAEASVWPRTQPAG